MISVLVLVTLCLVAGIYIIVLATDHTTYYTSSCTRHDELRERSRKHTLSVEVLTIDKEPNDSCGEMTVRMNDSGQEFTVCYYNSNAIIIKGGDKLSLKPVYNIDDVVMYYVPVIY